MNTQPEALRLADALDAEFVQGRISNSTGRESAVELRRLALKAEQEPVAWMHNFIEGNVITHRPADIGRHPERWTPLYTAPPRKQWVGLTDEERHSIREWRGIQKELGPVWAPMLLYLYEAIEAKLKEKNT